MEERTNSTDNIIYCIEQNDTNLVNFECLKLIDPYAGRINCGVILEGFDYIES